MADDLGAAAVRDRDLVLRRHFDGGQLTSWPAKQSRQLACLDHIAARFVPGVHYTEAEVTLEMRVVGADAVDGVTLRRALIDFGLMDRSDGRYWRCGGTVDLDR